MVRRKIRPHPYFRMGAVIMMSDKLFTQMLNNVTCGDCIDVVAHLPSGTVDFVLTDPPLSVRPLYILIEVGIISR